MLFLFVEVEVLPVIVNVTMICTCYYISPEVLGKKKNSSKFTNFKLFIFCFVIFKMMFHIGSIVF